MDFIIENLSSPGAHFSNNTNNVLLKIHNWINENNSPELMFNEFRHRLELEKKINNNNLRNICPLLKNCGFAQYESRSNQKLCTEKFFTENGLAYIEVLSTIKLIEQEEEYTEQQKKDAIEQLKLILSDLVNEALGELLKRHNLSYRNGIIWYLEYILKFNKVNKYEFAYIVYQSTKFKDNWYEKIKNNIEMYRKGELKLNVKVKIRNDHKIKESTGKETRLEGISCFSCYDYYSRLINQAGITRKVKDYYYLNNNMVNRVIKLLEMI